MVPSYAEARVVQADRLIPLPAGIDDRTAAAVLLKGLTAHYLLRRTHKVAAGQTILLHAAAGGVGQAEAEGINAGFGFDGDDE